MLRNQAYDNIISAFHMNRLTQVLEETYVADLHKRYPIIFLTLYAWCEHTYWILTSNLQQHNQNIIIDLAILFKIYYALL